MLIAHGVRHAGGPAMGYPGGGSGGACCDAPLGLVVVPAEGGRSAAEMQLARLTAANEPLTGEAPFFEAHYHLGFWSSVPSVVPPPRSQHPGAAPAPLQDLGRYKPPEACRYGQQCRFKLSCSRFHGANKSQDGVNCACEDESCTRGG